MNQVELLQREPTADEVEMPQINGKYLTFVLDNQLFAIQIADVVQIVGIQQITSIPEFPHYMKGIINLRGSIIPVIDVRLRFNKPEKAYDERTCIIVTQINELVIGLIVDAVDAVADISESDIAPPPKVVDTRTTTYITGIAKQQTHVILVLNTARIISDPTLKGMLDNIEKGAY